MTSRMGTKLEVGAKVMALAARTVKKVVLELGGKSPNIMLPGTDPARVAGPSVLRFCRNAGQAIARTRRAGFCQQHFQVVENMDDGCDSAAVCHAVLRARRRRMRRIQR